MPKFKRTRSVSRRSQFLIRIFGPLITCFAGAVIILNAVGLAISPQTTRSATVTVRASPTEIFSVLSDIGGRPRWKRNAVVVKSSSGIGADLTKFRTAGGTLQMVIVKSECKPPNRLVMALGSNSSSYRAVWIYDLSPIGPATTRIVLTEQAHASNPLVRVVLSLSDPTTFLRQDLEDLQQKFAREAPPKDAGAGGMDGTRKLQRWINQIACLNRDLCQHCSSSAAV